MQLIVLYQFTIILEYFWKSHRFLSWYPL